MLEAQLREQHLPVSAERAAQARDALPAMTRQAVGALIADHGPRAREHLAYQALGEWTPEHREAFRTLAAASPELRAQTFAEVDPTITARRKPAEPVTAGPSVSHPRTVRAPSPTGPGVRAGEPVERGTGPAPRDQSPPSQGEGE